MSAPHQAGERVASLRMYVDPPPLRQANARLWAHVRDSLRAERVEGVPDMLDETSPHDAAWLDPRLLLAQTCGYPYATRLRGHVQLVATPCYDYAGCDGPIGGSFLIVRVDDPATSIAELVGRRAAINYPTSNSGYNLFRAAIAPRAEQRPFFAEVVETGGHGASIAAIASGAADVAAIDCVPWGSIERHAPERLPGLRILAETPKTPGLPLITRASASDTELATLRSALDRVAADPAMAQTCATIGLRGFAVLDDADYDIVLQLESDAIGAGYPVIA